MRGTIWEELHKSKITVKFRGNNHFVNHEIYGSNFNDDQEACALLGAHGEKTLELGPGSKTMRKSFGDRPCWVI